MSASFERNFAPHHWVHAAVVLTVLLLTGCGATTKIIRDTKVVTKTTTTTRTIGATASTDSGPVVYVETCCGQPVTLRYKPSEINYYGGQQYVGRIRWLTYGGDTAVGRGKWGQNDCHPDCADGHYTYTAVTIILSTREFCRGATAYRDWTIKGIDLGPSVLQPQPINSQGCA